MAAVAQARSSASPHDLQGWLAQAETFQPTILDASACACAALAQDANANIPRLTEIVLSDPGLALHLLTQVNRNLTSKGRQPATTVNHITLLQGLPTVLAAPSGLPHLDKLPAATRDGLLRSFNRARQTATLLSEWGQRHPALATEEAFLDGLLHHLPEQFLWQCAPDLALVLESIQPTADESQDEREQAMLGCTGNELGVALAQAWHLSRDLRDSFRGDLPAHQTTPLAIRHAARLVRLSEWGWYGEAMDSALDTCAAALGFAPERLIVLHHHAAVRAARAAARYYPGVCPSAWLLPDLPGLPASLHPEPRPGPSVIPPAPAQVRPQTPATASIRDTDTPRDTGVLKQGLLRHYLDELAQGASEGLKPQDAIVLGLRTLVEGAGFERASFCLLNETREALHVRFCQARKTIPQLQGKVFEIRTANLLRALMQKPQRIYIDAGKRAKYQPMMPDSLRRDALGGEIALMSIYIKDKPLGLLLAEAITLEPVQRKVCKHVGQLIIKTIQTQNS